MSFAATIAIHSHQTTWTCGHRAARRPLACAARGRLLPTGVAPLWFALIISKVTAAMKATKSDPMRIAGLFRDEKDLPCDQRVSQQ